MPTRLDTLFLAGEQAAFNAALMDLTMRHTYAEDPEKAIAEHARLACAWIREGRVLVSVPGLHPEERL